MEENDPINMEYSRIIGAMGDEALGEFERAEFDIEVDTLTELFTNVADHYAEIFDRFTVAAALAIVAKDYHTAIGGDEE